MVRMALASHPADRREEPARSFRGLSLGLLPNPLALAPKPLKARPDRR
jgi:hypothetical protein